MHRLIKAMATGTDMVIGTTSPTPTIQTQNRVLHSAASKLLLQVQLLVRLQDMIINMITTTIMSMMQTIFMIMPS